MSELDLDQLRSRLHAHPPNPACMRDDPASMSQAGFPAAKSVLHHPSQTGPSQTGPSQTGPSQTGPSQIGEPGEAAVLVGLIERMSGPTVLLTRRRNDLRTHPGQICFPGGKRDPGDCDPVATALREAREEVGLDPQRGRLLGFLDLHLTGSQFRITPVVVALRPPLPLCPNPDEVEEIFEMPLVRLLDKTHHRMRFFKTEGKRRKGYAIMHEGFCIWGATARILTDLSSRLVAGAG